jgi:hypothetical protein
MTTQLATMHRRDEPTSGRASEASVEELLHAALRQLRAEKREHETRRRAFKVELDASAKRAVLAASARQAMRQSMLSVDSRWFWNFAGEAMDDLRQQRGEAVRSGEQRRADQLGDRIERLGAELDKIQKREARR